MAGRKLHDRLSRGSVPLTAAVIAASAFLARDGDAFQSMHLPLLYAERSDAKVTFSDVIAFVNRHGWPADLGRMCVGLGLSEQNPDCRFKQFAVQVGEERLDNHGFNVPSETAKTDPYVVMFHLRPIVGEFFVVSATGQLLATFYRAQGVDYSPISSDYSRSAFEAERSFWQKYLARFERDPQSTPKPTAPGSEMRR